MKRISTFILAVFIISNLFSQEVRYEKPDYKKIKKEIKKKRSEYYYQKLLDRYTNGDTTFSLKEKRYLYYGYSFQKEYSPYGSSVYSDSLKEYYSKDTLTKKDFAKIIDFSSALLQENPFDLEAVKNLRYSYNSLDSTELASQCNYRLYLVIDAIMSTGNGLSEESAFYVIDVSNEYDLIRSVGFTFGGEQSLIDTGYDYLTLQENKYEIEGLYFEISRCMEQLDLLFK